ncbi:MAG: endo-1,4-beta-xylanase [Opitutaceae bacterium]|jgi:GH35 family endo-1,4-beta-xylanase
MLRFTPWLRLFVGIFIGSAADGQTAGAVTDGSLLGPAAGIVWSTYGDPTFQVNASVGEVVWKITAQTPGRQTGAFTRARLPGATEAIRVSADYKAAALERGEKAWHNARIRVDFLNDAGAKIGESCAIDRIEGTSPAWMPLSRQFPVPAGATQVNIALELFLARSGAIEFRDLVVRALDHEAAGAWRTEADARIEKHRKAPLSVTVVDAAGDALPGARVAVRMRRHAYPFGTAVVAAKLLNEPATDDEKNYRDTFLAFFNYATFEGALKQKYIEKHTLQPAVDALKLLRSHDIRARGHVLVWPSWKQSARALEPIKEDPLEVEKWIQDHIRRTVGATAGLTADWDVMNEPVVHNDIMRLIGREKVADWFRLAREADPKTSLYLNENNVEFNGSNQDALAGWIDYLRARGAPLDGVGWQGHMWHRTLPYAPGILDDLRRFEKFGLKVQITEYDCNDRFGDEEEARFLGDFLHAWFSHPLTDGFIMWGFFDGSSWTNNAPLFNRDWSLKPAGKVWMDYVFRQWWSDADGATDARGRFTTRAILGDYVVQVVHDGKVETVEARLAKEGLALKVTLTAASAVWDDSRRLPDYNPYRSGKLPKVLELPPSSAKAASQVTISTDEGEGADAVVGPAAPLGAEASLSLAGGPDMKSRRDLYLRFDLSKQGKGDVTGADLVLKPAGEPAAPFRAKVYALSDRFVPVAGEMGEHWTESLIAAANAPGREPTAADYRQGDAALIYLGDWRASAADGVVRWRSKELAAAVERALGKTITLLIVPDEGVQASFRSKEYGASEAPCLTIQYY